MKIRLLVVAVVFLSACSNPQEANRDNLGTAIGAELAFRGACIDFPHGFPLQIEDGDREKPGFDALVRTGILSMQRVQRNDGWLLGGKRQVSVYDATEQGARFLRNGSKGSHALGAELCYGKPELAEIENFTAPADNGGHVATSVAFTYSVSDMPDWARQPEMALLDRRLSLLARGKTVGDRALLVLTAKGWMHGAAVERQLAHVEPAAPDAPPVKVPATASSATKPADTVTGIPAPAVAATAPAGPTPEPSRLTPPLPAATIAAPAAPAEAEQPAKTHEQRRTSKVVTKGTKAPSTMPVQAASTTSASELRSDLPSRGSRADVVADQRPYKTPDGRTIIPAPPP